MQIAPANNKYSIAVIVLGASAEYGPGVQPRPLKTHGMAYWGVLGTNQVQTWSGAHFSSFFTASLLWETDLSGK